MIEVVEDNSEPADEDDMSFLNDVLKQYNYNLHQQGLRTRMFRKRYVCAWKKHLYIYMYIYIYIYIYINIFLFFFLFHKDFKNLHTCFLFTHKHVSPSLSLLFRIC